MFTERQRDTILAALRRQQDIAEGRTPDEDGLREIATNGDPKAKPLDGDEIDTLCDLVQEATDQEAEQDADVRRTVIRIDLGPEFVRYTRLLRNPARGDDDETEIITALEAFRLLSEDATAEVSFGDGQGHALEGDEFEVFSP